jgi:hypothetical protein
MVIFVLIGPALVFYGYYADHRDRPSLQWPKVSGVVMQCEQVFHRGRNSHYTVTINYTYFVNGRRYLGSRIALWSPDWSGGGGRTQAFVITYPVRSTTDVYYDPQNPENAVLIPGANEEFNHSLIRIGYYGFVPLLWLAFQARKSVARIKARLESARAHRSAKAERLPEGYASYEPGDRRKLNIFPDKECLMEVLGHKGAPLQEWKTEDRVIDATGREYRLVKEPGKKCYDLAPTGETWSYERLLNVAESEVRRLRNDPEAFRRRLDGVAAEDRLSVLMKYIDEPSTKARWVMAGFFAFLVLFFVVVVFVAGKIISLFLK